MTTTKPNGSAGEEKRVQPTGQSPSRILYFVMLGFVVLAIVGFLVLGPLTGKTGSLSTSKHTAMPSTKR